LGDLRLYRARVVGPVEETDEIGRVAGEVEIARIEDLELELGADRERRGGLELERLAHGSLPSPARVNANWTAIGPAISRTITAESTIVESRARNSGYRSAVPCTIAIAMPDIGVSARHRSPAVPGRTPEKRAKHMMAMDLPAKRDRI